MENENKVGEEKIEEVNLPAGGEETKTEESNKSVDKEEKKCCGVKGCNSKCKKCGMGAIAIVLVLLVAVSFAYRIYRQKIDVGPNAVKAKVQTFLKENVPDTTKSEIKDVVKEGALYKVTIEIDSQEVPVYITMDGKKLIQAQAAIDLDQKQGGSEKQTQAPEKTEAENKNDVPVVDLFVMSYCPYGLQMERGALPAVEALGNKIKFNLKFVDYALHGQKEVDENVNQYCIGKTQPAKLNAYLKCFWKDSKGTAEACMKTVGVNAAQVSTCVADAKKQFNPTEKSLGINKEETTKFGVQGSPTLVVNGTTVSSGRDSASVLKAICSGFTTQPKECQAKLSATSPGAGFDDQVAASAGGSAPAASCETPQQ